MHYYKILVQKIASEPERLLMVFKGDKVQIGFKILEHEELHFYSIRFVRIWEDEYHQNKMLIEETNMDDLFTIKTRRQSRIKILKD